MYKKILRRLVTYYISTRTLLKFLIAKTRKQKIIFLLATPSHSNLGDQAIVFTELKFLNEKLLDHKAIEVPLVSMEIFQRTCSFVKKLSSRDDVIMGHGGGNMGDQYPKEEAARRLIVETFPENKIVIFPQTADFTRSDAAESELSMTQELYGGHKNLTLIAREEVSYEFMQENFPANKILLTPDIVLYLIDKQVSTSKTRKGSATFLRQDAEKSSTVGLDNLIQEVAKKHFTPLFKSDTLSGDRLILTERLRLKRLKAKWSEFSSKEIAVTDRLHGMVFAAITDTPCLVFTNYNHKVTGTYEWIRGNPNIQLCTDINDLTESIIRMKEYGALEYKKPDLSKYWDLIANEVNISA